MKDYYTVLPILTTALMHFSLKGWENVLFELGSERVWHVPPEGEQNGIGQARGEDEVSPVPDEERQQRQDAETHGGENVVDDAGGGAARGDGHLQTVDEAHEQHARVPRARAEPEDGEQRQAVGQGGAYSTNHLHTERGTNALGPDRTGMRAHESHTLV